MDDEVDVSHRSRSPLTTSKPSRGNSEEKEASFGRTLRNRSPACVNTPDKSKSKEKSTRLVDLKLVEAKLNAIAQVKSSLNKEELAVVDNIRKLIDKM